MASVTPPLIPDISVRSHGFIQNLFLESAGFKSALKAGEKLRILYAGAFGEMRVRSVMPIGDEFIKIAVEGGDSKMRLIISNISECSFMFEGYIPSEETKAEDEQEPVITGFAMVRPEVAK